MKTIAISGASGFVGSNLKEFYVKKGFEAIGIKRDELSDETKLLNIIEKADVLINLSGASILAKWTDRYKKILYESRINTTKNLVNAMKKVKNKPELFISTSAVGIYKEDKCYDENTKDYADTYLAKITKDWENQALMAKEFGVRTAIFRFGVVLGNGGALAKMLLPFKLGLGGNIGDGKQYFSFIHIKDLLKAYDFILENSTCEGLYNLSSPQSITNVVFTKALGKTLHRPTLIPIPKFALSLIFGEGASVLTNGQCAKPTRLTKSGFKFSYEKIDEALTQIIDNDIGNKLVKIK